ncbi:hypothetical protein ACFXA4_04490 [Streptomyces sp. NPDC059442]|uniref:hypothetical protein n=1 Tax=Streptomyces sp. NPDC059442 TaxID=3346830 RepID=UPI00367A3D1F
MTGNGRTAPAPGPSTWQRRIAGEWHGRPSLFDAQGTWCGYEDIRRSSEFTDGRTLYRMDGGLCQGGPLAGRFQLAAPFAFGVSDADDNRLYTGPDFHGSGQPYGSFVDAHYYGPGWQVALNTWNHVLPDGRTQVYSSVLHQGWTVIGCFNGVYVRTTDHDTDEATRAHVARHLAAETDAGPVPWILPTKQPGAFTGSCELWSAEQKHLGEVEVEIVVRPVDLLRARHDVTWRGAGLDRSFTVERRRDGTREFWEGPDAWGNAQAFGRASFPLWHFTDGDVHRVRGREFALDARPGMAAGGRLAVTYELFGGNVLAAVLHGVLDWESAS